MKLLQITNTVNDDIKELLDASVIGTPGSGMLYQHKSIDKRINEIKVPLFVELRTRLKLIGTCCFCFRETLNQKTKYQSFYIRYFSFKEGFRARRTLQPRARGGKLRDEIKALLDSEHFTSVSTNKYFHYAYVDPQNTRSVLLCEEFGFQYVRRFATFVFSRLQPRIEPGITVSKVEQEEYSEVKNLLVDKYSDFNMVSFDGLFDNDPYYVVRDSNGRIIAGARVSPTTWRIYQMHNSGNTILLSLLSNVPFINRLVNKEFKFLALDALYFTDGYEHHTEALLTFLLRKYNHFNVFMPADRDSSLYRHLEKLNHGIVSKISKQVSTNVICRFHNFSSSEIQQFKQYPAYVSALDIT